MNIKAEQIELEKERKHNAAQWYNTNWDLVVVEGKLSVTNNQDKPITLEVTKSLSGEVKAMQPRRKARKACKVPANGKRKQRPDVDNRAWAGRAKKKWDMHTRFTSVRRRTVF